MSWGNETKEIIQYVIAVLTILFGLGLSVAGFIVDPTGEIDGSVLAIAGECLTFAGMIFGVSLHYSSELKKFKNDVNRHIKEETDNVSKER